MRVRDWQDLLTEVVESDAEAADWRAVAGSRRRGIGEDLFLGHPSIGLFQLKTYAKNPFEVKGVGSKVARSLDDEIGSYLPREAGGRFAVQSPPTDEDDARTKARRVEETIKAHAEAPTTPEDLFGDVMSALDSPAYGPVEYGQTERPEGLAALAGTFEEADELLDAELDDLIDDDGIGRGFG